MTALSNMIPDLQYDDKARELDAPICDNQWIAVALPDPSAPRRKLFAYHTGLAKGADFFASVAALREKWGGSASGGRTRAPAVVQRPVLREPILLLRGLRCPLQAQGPTQSRIGGPTA
eukprot:3720199-Alexandrium_andersonii.AAC.1